jgi:hypothetical protein
LENLEVIQQSDDPTDPSSDENADFLTITTIQRYIGVSDGLSSGFKGEVRKAVVSPGDSFPEEDDRVEILDFGRDLHIQIRGIEQRDAVNATAPLK